MTPVRSPATSSHRRLSVPFSYRPEFWESHPVMGELNGPPPELSI
jgi:hypothetical protein